MKKTIILSFLASIAMGATAQTIQATHSVVDLGQVQYCRPTSGTFELKNAGKKPMKITRVDTGCGCVVATYPENTINSGEKFALTVTYDARMMGHFDKVIEVYNDLTDKPLQIDLRGQVVEEVVDFVGDFPFKLGEMTADCNYVEFEDVRLGEVLQQRFHIYNPTSKAVYPQIMHLPPYLKAEVSPSKVGSRRSAEVTLTLDSRHIREYGLTQTQVYLGANPGEKVSASKEIGVSAVLIPGFNDLTQSQLDNAPHLNMSAKQVSLSIADGKKKSEVIELTNTGKSRLEIQNLQMFTVGLQVQLNKRFLEPGESAKLKITTNPKELKTVRTMPRIIMITNDPDNGKVVVYVNVK